MTHSSPSAIAWEERPVDNAHIVWRYSGSAIIPHILFSSSNDIFDGAVASFKEELAGIFCCDNKKREWDNHRALIMAVRRISMEQLFSFFDKQFPEDITLLPTELSTRRSCGCNTCGK